MAKKKGGIGRLFGAITGSPYERLLKQIDKVVAEASGDKALAKTLKKLVTAIGQQYDEENIDDEEVPLNDPFAGNEASSSANMNIPDGEQEDEMSLYNFKLAGLISGKDHSYISLVNSSGEFVNLTIGQFLGKVKLIDLRITEAIFEKEDKAYLIIDFNNQIRETNEY